MKKKIFLLLAGSLLALVAYFAIVIHKAWQDFGAECRIHGIYDPVVDALQKYSTDNGSAADSLEKIIPQYLSELPKSYEVVEVIYTIAPDGDNWRVTLVSDATGKTRHYIAESGMPLTESETNNLVMTLHGRWQVLEPTVQTMP